MGSQVKSMICSEGITASRYEPSQAVEWRVFLEESTNGTLFHNLDFLAYHPPERFDVHHLMFRLNGKLVGLLPAAIVNEPSGRRFLKSPYGGSVGGFVLSLDHSAITSLKLVTCLKDYIRNANLAGVEMRIGPNIYDKCPNDVLSFALTASGFTLAGRWLSHVVVLPSDPAEVLDRLVSGRRRSYVRSALNQGLEVTAAGPDYLPSFYRILEENRAKHSARPTHTLAELERIFQLTPDRVRLFVCRLQDELIAGSLVFELNDRVAYSFYPCHDHQFERYRPAAVVTVGIAQYYAGHGFRYLDLGPTTFDDFSLNEGLARFKEEMGGAGFCRDTWRWEVGK